MNAEPLVTIGIPVYNEENYLAQTIESAINQTYKNIQIIISDNCSTDGSFEIAQKYAEQDSRILLVRQKKNIGATENFRYVLEKATSEYFCWLGGHDKYDSNYIETLLPLHYFENTTLVYTDTLLFDENGIITGDGNTNTIACESNSIITRAVFVLENLTYCYAIHGLFLTSFIKTVKFIQVPGPDRLLIFSAALHGIIRVKRGSNYFALQPRQESIEEAHARQYKQQVHTIDYKIDKEIRILSHLYYCVNLKNQNLYVKLRLLFSTFKTYKRILNMNLSLKSLKKIYLAHFYLKKVLKN